MKLQKTNKFRYENSQCTSVLLNVIIGLLAIDRPVLAVTLPLQRPDHQRCVCPAYRQQRGVILCPAHVGHMGAVAHVLLEAGILTLGRGGEINLLCFS